MRWLVITDDGPPAVGGVAITTHNLIVELVHRGHEVTVLARRPFSIPGVTYVGVGGRHFSKHGPKRLYRRAEPLLCDVDVIWGTTWSAVQCFVNSREWMPRFLTRPPLSSGVRCKKKLLITIHGSDGCGQQLIQGRKTLLEGTCLSVSSYLQAELSKQGIPSIVLPAAVAPPTERVVANRQRRWLFVARPGTQKGEGRVIDLARAVGIPLDIVGPVRSQVSGVRYLGLLPHGELLKRYWKTEAVFCLPKRREDGCEEGLGLSLIEGAMRGAVPVGCDVGGVAEAVGEGVLLDHQRGLKHWIAQLRGLKKRSKRCQKWATANHGTSRACDVLVNTAQGRDGL